MPSGAGGSASVGVSRTSIPSKYVGDLAADASAAPAPTRRYCAPLMRAAELDEGPAQRLHVAPRRPAGPAASSQSAMAQALLQAHWLMKWADEGVAVDRRAPPPRPGARATRTAPPSPRPPPRSRGGPSLPGRRRRHDGDAQPPAAPCAAAAAKDGPRRGGAQ